MSNNQKHISEGSAILYGVPKVGYGPNGITPYPVCLKACANYLGQEVGYDTVMAGSGAAFRLTWDMAEWNGGNVDVVLTFDEPAKIYRLGIEALGRECRMLGRTPETGKAEFIDFIKTEIDNGYPVIALGIIGPPEACIVTGYRDNGQTLLGWNFFQDNPEFGASVSFDESGYFISKNWWENRDSVALIAIGEKTGDGLSLKDVLANAIEVLSPRKVAWHPNGLFNAPCDNGYAKGLLAYDYWKKAIGDDSQFPQNAIMPLLVERMMCQGDATDCLIDGRPHAASYFRAQAEACPEHAVMLNDIADCFKALEPLIMKIYNRLGGWERGEKEMLELAKPETRRELCVMIEQCKGADQKALDAMKRLYSVL